MASKMAGASFLCLATLLLSMCPVKAHDTPKRAIMPIRPNVSASSVSAPDSPITYHGGPVMVNTINVYPIWYGKSGFTDTQKNILRNLIQSYSDNGDTCAKCNQDPGVGGCKCDSNCDCTDKCAKCEMPVPWGGCKCDNNCDCKSGFHNPVFEPNGAPTVQNWWGVELEYYQSDGQHVSPVVVLAQEYSDTEASQGSKNPDMFKIVTHAISKGLRTDPDGLYTIFTDTDVTVEGFCSEFCGYHTYGGDGEQTLKYTFVGNAGKQCPSGCTPQPSTSPNGDVGIDGMASVFSHELAEAASDPLLNAWTDSNGENADKCAWGHLGTTYDAAKGGKYNLVGNGGTQYMIQSNWDLATNSCQLTAGARSTVVVS